MTIRQIRVDGNGVMRSVLCAAALAALSALTFVACGRGVEKALSRHEQARCDLFTAVGWTECHRARMMYQRLGLVRDYFKPDLGRPLA